jgi:hypothetical protein
MTWYYSELLYFTSQVYTYFSKIQSKQIIIKINFGQVQLIWF